jgi:hypothetical protein
LGAELAFVIGQCAEGRLVPQKSSMKNRAGFSAARQPGAGGR